MKENIWRKRWKALTVFLLAAILTAIPVCESISAAGSSGGTATQIFFASDYQGTTAKTNLKKICKQMKNAGAKPKFAVWCGDYVDDSEKAEKVSQSADR